AGAQRARGRSYAGWEREGQLPLPAANGVSYLPAFAAGTVQNVFPRGGIQRQSGISPLYAWGDSLTWVHRRHTYKAGGDARFVSTNGFATFLGVEPAVNSGAGGVPVSGFA